MSLDRSYDEQNTRERERMRALVERLGEDDLRHAIEPRHLAQLALRLAEETDQRVASLPPDRMFPQDPDSPVNALRADHRGEHLDDIEAALRDREGSTRRDG